MTVRSRHGTAHPASKPGETNVICIASGKGGVGKTWLAVSLAQALAQRHQVLLFDGDLGLANVDIQLGLDVPRDLGAVVAGRMAMHDAVIPCQSTGFDVLAGKSGSGVLAELTAPRIKDLRADLEVLASRYDHVIVDLGAGVESAIRALTPAGATTLVVATDEPTSLTDAYAYIKVSRARDATSDLRIVINMAKDRRQGERVYGTLAKACQSFLKATPPLAGIVRRDERVRDAIRHQMPFLSRHPAGDTADDVKAIARSINTH